MLKLNRDQKRIAVIVAVVLIPLVYSFFYLYAFWDPYSKLKELPVALVNEDKGAEINGSLKNVGNEIVDQLKTDESLKWVVTDKINADEGLKNRNYYAEIRIPADFSQEISTADKEKKTEGVLIYAVNEKRNFLAAQVLNRGILELKDKISKNITKEIVNNIAVEVKKLPDDLQQMESKLGEAADGSKELSDGITQLKENQIQYNDGISKLNQGISDLKNGSEALVNGQKEFYSKLSAGIPDINKLTAGANQFGSKLTELNSGSTKLNAGAASLNEGIVKLNSGLESLNNSLNTPNTGLADFAKGASSFGSGLQMFADGFSSAKAASEKISAGTADYSDKLKAYSQGLDQYVGSVKTLTAADKTIADYISSYIKLHPEAMSDKNIQGIMAIYEKSNGSIDQLTSASDSIKTNMGALVSGAQQLQSGSKQLSDGISQISDKSKDLMTGAAQLSAGANKVGTGVGQLSDAVKQLSGGASQLAVGSEQLSARMKDLTTGSTQLTSAYSQINGGIQETSSSMTATAEAAGQLYSGSQKIETGLTDAYKGTKELTANGTKFIEAEEKLAGGASELQAGLESGKNEVTNKLSEASDKTKKLDGIDQYASEPVKMQDERINPVPDYGTAFAPYFMSLSLWVGALLIFYTIYLDSEIKFTRRSKNSKGILRYFSYYLLAIVQAIVLGVVLEKGLNLHVKNNLLFYGVCILVSLTFIAIMQFLIVHLGEVGKFLAILLLILQLTACGGTFPMELVPKFFNVINAFMPMTYTVNAFKEVISGIDYSYLSRNGLILGAIMVAFLLISFVLSRKNHTDIEEDEQMQGKVIEKFSM